MEQKVILIGLVLIILIGGLGLFFFQNQQELLIELIFLMPVDDFVECPLHASVCFRNGLKAGKIVRKTFTDEKILLMTKEKILKISLTTLMQVKPIENEKYEVTMSVLDLKELNVDPSTMINTHMGISYNELFELGEEYRITDECPLVLDDFEKNKLKTKTCIVSSLDEVFKLEDRALDEGVICENQPEITKDELCERKVFYSYSFASQVD